MSLSLQIISSLLIKYRKNLNELDAWLLILDTKGVNVWCSAGKGTFGTKELVHRIQAASLGSVVKHRRLILPQLGATGAAAHLVKEESGFTVIYGTGQNFGNTIFYSSRL